MVCFVPLYPADTMEDEEAEDSKDANTGHDDIIHSTLTGKVLLFSLSRINYHIFPRWP